MTSCDDCLIKLSDEIFSDCSYLLGFFFVFVDVGTKVLCVVVLLVGEGGHTSDSCDAEGGFTPGLFGVESFLDVW